MRKGFYAITIIMFVIAGFAFYQGNNADRYIEEEELITVQNLVEIPALPGVDTFGFITDGMDVVDDKIGRNESLYIILRRHGVSPQLIHRIQQTASGNVNLNRLMPGQQYRIYKENEEAIAFAWQQTPTQYVTISWDDEISIDRGNVPIERRHAEIAGVVQTSLYEAVTGQRVSQRLGVELGNIFGWQVDFFGIRQGDHFKALYENLYANGEYLGIGEIEAAEFQHRGRVHRAYYFNNGERSGYFDAEGNSMEKALLKAPFRYNQRISSGFTRNRFHPILKVNRPHYGTDYAAPTGTPIIAVGDGVVTEAQRRGGNGNIVQIRHNSTYRTAYLHLNGFAPGIRAGAHVEQGQVIGYVGQTGLATGPHLCYRLYENGQPVNSVTHDMPASESLEQEYMDEFKLIVSEMDERLDSLQLDENLAMN
jgi:murein DD-endopeptidase MepM/ murein hydrolase activator NlpD